MVTPRSAKAPRRAASPTEVGTRDKILDVAEALIAQRGMEGMRLKDVAERVGIQPPSLFAYFDGREALAAAVSQRLVGSLGASIPEALNEDPVEQLRGSVMKFVGHLLERPAHARLILRELAQADSPGLEADEATNLMMQQQEALIADRLREGVRRGVFRRVRPRSVLAQLVGAATANIAWQGWDEIAADEAAVSAKTLTRETADLIVRYVAR